MTQYICYNCRNTIDVEKLVGETFCKNCSCTILFKMPPPSVKRVICD